MKNKPPTEKTCFVLMPISNPDGYDEGHFNRVYEHLIKPACVEAKLSAMRADDVRATNYIVIDILQKILSSDLVLCDLSSRNPNVLYELGIRQAFNLPVVLIKDHSTERIFDIQGIRTLEYDSRLRIDSVKNDVNSLRAALTATLEQPKSDINSLIRLLSVPKAELQTGSEISPETALILTSLRDVGQRITQLEEGSSHDLGGFFGRPKRGIGLTLPSGEDVELGDDIYVRTNKNGKPELDLIGMLIAISNDGVALRRKDGFIYLIPPDDESYLALTSIPF